MNELSQRDIRYHRAVHSLLAMLTARGYTLQARANDFWVTIDAWREHFGHFAPLQHM